MSNDNRSESLNWDNLSTPVKRYAMIGLAMLGMILSLQMGASPLQVVVGLGVLGVYAAFPKEINQWYESNQGILIGGALGFFWAPPFGLPLGALLGHFLHDKYIQILNTANQVKEVVRPIVAPGNWLKEKAVDPVVASGLWLKDKAGGLINGAVNGISNAFSDMGDALESFDDDAEIDEPLVHEASSVQQAPESIISAPAANPVLSSKEEALPVREAQSLMPLNNVDTPREEAAPLYNRVTSALQNVGNMIPQSPVSPREMLSAGKSMINNGLSYLKSFWPNNSQDEEALLHANAPVYFASLGPGAMQKSPAPGAMQEDAVPRTREESSSSSELRRSTRKRKRTTPFTL